MHTQEGVTPNKRKELDAHSNMELTEMFRAIMTTMATKEDIAAVRSEMATKADIGALRAEMITDITSVRSDMAKLGQDLRDHTSRECAKLRGDFTSALRKVDEKVDELVDAVHRGGVIARAELKRIRQMGPFPRLA